MKTEESCFLEWHFFFRLDPRMAHPRSGKFAHRPCSEIALFLVAAGIQKLYLARPPALYLNANTAVGQAFQRRMALGCSLTYVMLLTVQLSRTPRQFSPTPRITSPSGGPSGGRVDQRRKPIWPACPILSKSWKHMLRSVVCLTFEH